MPQNAQKQVITVEQPTASHPATWRLSRRFIVLFLRGSASGVSTTLGTIDSKKTPILPPQKMPWQGKSPSTGWPWGARVQAGRGGGIIPRAQPGVETVLGPAPNAAFQVRQESPEGPWPTRGQHQEASSAGFQAFTSDPINRPYRAVGSVPNVFAQFVQSGANGYLPAGC